MEFRRVLFRSRCSECGFAASLTLTLGTVTTMKGLVRLLLCLAALGLVSEPASHAKDYLVQLRGVVDVEGLRTALLELDYTLPGPASDRRAITRLMHEGEVLEPETGRSPKVELVAVDAPHMRIK